MSTKNLYIPALGGLAKQLEPLALPLLRVIVGFVFIYHGYPKLMAVVSGEGLGALAGGMIEPSGLPFPYVLAWLALITEFIGGICLILGLFTRLWALMGAGMMYLIILFIRGFGEIHHARGGFEYDLALAGILSVLFIFGSGALALDNKLKKTF